MAAAFVATPFFQLFSQRAIFILPPIAGALILVAGMTLAPRLQYARYFQPFSPRRSVWPRSFLVFWMLLSLLWTPFPAEASARLLKSLLTLACVLPAAASLPARTRAANLYFLPLGVALAAVTALVFSTPGLSGGLETEAQGNLRHRRRGGAPAAVAGRWRRPTCAGARPSRPRSSSSPSRRRSRCRRRAPLARQRSRALAFALAWRNPAITGRWLGRLGAACFLFAPLAPLLLNLKGGPNPPPLAGQPENLALADRRRRRCA